MGGNGSRTLKPPAKLTEAEKVLIYRTWHDSIVSDDHIGGKVFDRMFAEAPEVRRGFSMFSEIDVNDEHYNEILHRHGSRVKNAVGKVVEKLHNRNEAKTYLMTLGCRHFNEYKFEPKYINVIFSYFLNAIKDTLGDDYTEEVEEAYSKLFQIIQFYMVNSLL